MAKKVAKKKSEKRVITDRPTKAERREARRRSVKKRPEQTEED